MLFAGKPMHEVSEQDLLALVAQGVAERRTLDYKRDLPSLSDKDKAELCADASSFANADGGYLIFGMEEKGGVPVNVCGTAALNADEVVLRLESTVRSGVQPRIQGLVTQPVSLTSGRTAFVMRISRGWDGPYAVVRDGSFRVFTRNSAGKHMLDMAEVRAAFLRSGDVVERIKRFRDERLARIRAGQTPVSLQDAPKAVLLLVPFSALADNVRYDLSAPEQHNHVLASAHPVGETTTHFRFNQDGWLHFARRRDGMPCEGYVQFFWSGGVESVGADWAALQSSEKVFAGGLLEGYVITALRSYLAFLRQLGVEPPLLVMLSLLGVAGYHAVIPDGNFILGVGPIDRGEVLLRGLRADSLDEDAATLLRPALDELWNAAGRARSPNYDEQGRWRDPRIR